MSEQEGEKKKPATLHEQLLTEIARKILIRLNSDGVDNALEIKALTEAYVMVLQTH